MCCTSQQTTSFGVDDAQYSQAGHYDNCCNDMLLVLGHSYQDNAVSKSPPTSTDIELESLMKKTLAVLSHLVDWPRRCKLESLEEILQFSLNLTFTETISESVHHPLRVYMICTSQA